MNREGRSSRRDSGDGMTRRDFVRTVGAAAVAAGATPLFAMPSADKDRSERVAETAVKRLYTSLTDPQKKAICFPFDHDLRRRISANWKITKPRIGDDFYTAEQRKLIDQVLRGVSSPDGYERFQKQMKDDWGGFDRYHVAIFGEPGTGKFEFEMTGRHLTIRADGDSVERVAFGGPIVYGHGEGDPSENLFHYQTRKANEVFTALDGKQREKALLTKAPKESEVPIQGKEGKYPGVPVGGLSGDQKELVESVLRVVLAPYRKEDIDEAIRMLKAGGGLDKLHMAFYRAGDLDDDNVWDIWRVEGPTFVCHFRGAPHVHAYINVGIKAPRRRVNL